MTNASAIKLAQEGEVLIVTLNRPEKLNAIDAAMAQTLLQALKGAQNNDGVRAILLCGQGRAFCAGRDVSAPPTDADLVLTQAVSQAIVHSSKPVVAAVHGWVVGAGLEWMLDTDIVFAASDSRFKLPEAGLGVFVTGGVTATLANAVGLARAKGMLLLGTEVSAQQAGEWGMVWSVVEKDDLLARAMTAARSLAALKPEVAARFKKVLNAVGNAHFDEAVRLETQAQREL
jgi:2-(1,2-epoxy-1,2-dihydrophenyl)acetyl-CoA isomerase